jgi:hypothetical protein
VSNTHAYNLNVSMLIGVYLIAAAAASLTLAEALSSAALIAASTA